MKTRLNHTEKGDFNVTLTFMLVLALQRVSEGYAYATEIQQA